MDISVPVRSSRWSGTGTVVVRPPCVLCITMWLPRRLTSVKPWDSRTRQTSRPERGRSLANGNLDVGDIEFASGPALDFLGGRGLEE